MSSGVPKAGSSPVRDASSTTSPVLWSTLSTIGVLAAGIGIFVAISIVGWMLDRSGDAGAGSAAAIGLQGWYLAHGVTLPVSWGSLSLPPLGLTALLAYLLYRSGRSAVSTLGLRTWRGAAESLTAMVITYVTASLMLTSAVYAASSSPGLVDVGVRTALLTIVAAGSGMLRDSGLGAKLIGRLPGAGAAYARAAAAAGYAMLAAAGLVVAIALLMNFSEASAITAALAPAGPAGLTVLGLSLAYLPNALLAAAGIGLGATMNLGGTSVSLTGTQLGDLPAFPLLAALPSGLGVWATVLIPLAAVVVGGLVLVRQTEPAERSAKRLLSSSLLGGLILTAALAALTWWAHGALGGQALASVGISWLTIATLGAAVVCVGLSVVALTASARGLLAAPRSTSRAGAEPEDDAAPRTRSSVVPAAAAALGDDDATRAVRRLSARPSRPHGAVSTAPCASLSIVQKARAERRKAS